MIIFEVKASRHTRWGPPYLCCS